MKVAVVSRKLVKPSKPTLPHLRTYKISLLDELNLPMHMIRILYFSSDTIQGKNISLEESLAQVLPLFHPLAGRYNQEKHEVDCNDEGAEYFTAEVDCRFDQLVRDPDNLNSLLPVDIVDADLPTDPMCAVQINRFQCGGLAIGVCASHRIFDSCSLGIFLAAWANAATNGGGESVIIPDFDSPLHFPPENLPPLGFPIPRPRDRSIVAKRYVFDKDAISRLRERLSSEWKSGGIQSPPSRVVVTSTVLTQALLRADKAKHGRARATLIAQMINARERTVPPLSKHACGMWVAISHLEMTEDETEANAAEQNAPRMALRMRGATAKGVKDCARILSDKAYGRWALVDGVIEAGEKADNDDYKVIFVTDWSKFGQYGLDFGFGTPDWVSLAHVPLQNLFILMNTKNGDGIEAWVYLHESDSPFFEMDEQLRMLTLPSA